jgi:hypothetical protein
LARGYQLLGRRPEMALGDLIGAVPGLDRSAQSAQLEALTSSRAFARGDETATSRIDPASIERWRAWAERTGLLGTG